MALLHFKVGSLSDYDSVNKESNSLYFITDSGASRIYKGETLIATLNDDYIVDNTGNNIVVSLDNGVLSAELGEDIIADIEDLSSEWGEIPVAIIPSGIDENTYYYIYYDNDIDPPTFESYNNNAYFNFNDNYYLLTLEEWNYARKDRFRPDILGSNIQNIVHTLYNGNNIIQLTGPIVPTPVDKGGN